MDRLNKLNTAKEKISEPKEELKENSCTKHGELEIWKIQKGKEVEGMVRKPRVYSFRVTEGGERA